MKILALDLSLVATGVAIGPSGDLSTITAPKNIRGFSRTDYIVNLIGQLQKGSDLVIMEDLAMAAHDRNHERAGLAYIVRYYLWRADRKFVLVAPQSLKKFVTGKGNSEKSMMLKEVYKRWKVNCANDNEADAFGLLQIGRCLLGAKAENRSQAEVVAKLKPQLEVKR